MALKGSLPFLMNKTNPAASWSLVGFERMRCGDGGGEKDEGAMA